MSESTAAELVKAARCIDLCIPDGMKPAVIIWELAQIAEVSADPQSLINNARCIWSCVPAGMQSAIATDLLDKILAGGGGGSNACLLAGLGDPLAPPPCNVALYFDYSAGAPNLGLWIWIQALAVWTPLIAVGP